MKTIIAIILLGLIVLDSRYVNSQTIYEIPSPRASGGTAWCINMTGKISPEAISHINTVCEEVHQKVNKEMTVVVISTTSGRNHRQFGTDLFNHWGVGKWGVGSVFRNDGIMLFVALDDRRAEIILGKGIDDRRKERTAQQIIDDVIVPNFKADDPGSGLYEGIRTCATRLLAVAELDSPVQLPSVAASGGGVRAKVRQHKRRGPITWWPWILGITGVGGICAVFGGRYYLRYRPRHCPNCSEEMVLLKEEHDDTFLEDPEIVEENLGSVDYDVWACLKCDEVLKLRYGKLFTRYTKCPKCWYITVHRIERVLVNATYSHGGKVRVVEQCKSCNYHRSYTYRTPMKVRSTSSSSGSSFGGSSSGGGSGFGGGSSSGGGAGGGW